jgi:uncharacterized protein YuzB (UPF0349 family)
MKKVTVEFCLSNLVKGSLSTYYRLKELKHPEVKVKAISCLGYCGDCSQYLFALVNQELVEEKHRTICIRRSLPGRGVISDRAGHKRDPSTETRRCRESFPMP